MDPNLRQYATDGQWQALCEIEEHGGLRPAARATGKDNGYYTRVRQAVLAKAAMHGYAPDHDMTHPTAPGFRIKGTSTLYDEAGNARLQWVKTTRDSEATEAFALAAIEALRDEIIRADPIPAPADTLSHLLSAYVVGDHHFGMLSWHAETGESYSIPRGEQLLANAMRHLVSAAPAATEALVVLIGDFLHYDSFDAVTPTSGHRLDADSRFPRMVRAALRAVRGLVAEALAKHASVRLIVEIGNHDLSSSIWLMEALSIHYEAEPRVSVDTSPAHFHYHRFGSNLIGTHHGHGKAAKPGDLPAIMACDRAEDWGQTKHRIWFTGHIHNRQRWEAPGCAVESVPVLPPNDAYAANNGWRAQRGMTNIVFHREHGEVARNMVAPEMCE